MGEVARGPIVVDANAAEIAVKARLKLAARRRIERMARVPAGAGGKARVDRRAPAVRVKRHGMNLRHASGFGMGEPFRQVLRFVFPRITSPRRFAALDAQLRRFVLEWCGN